MLLKNQYNLKLKKTVPKILCFSTAFNNSFVFSQVIKPGETESIVHVDVEGNILFEHVYPDIINWFCMLNERQVIVMDVPRSHIDIINLETKKVRSIEHQYLFDDVAQMVIETFYQTKMFCIVEKGTFNDHRLRLTYYQYQHTEEPEKCKAVAEYQSKQNEWNYEFPVKRGNNHSMMLWFRQRHEGDIEFHYFDCRTDPKGKLETVRVNNTLGQPYNMQNFQLSMANVWETVPGTFMLVCNSNRSEANARNQHGILNNNYVLEKDTGVIREAKFDFPHKEEKDFSWNDQLIEYFYMGSVSVFHTFRHRQGVCLTTPVYYVNNETEKIVAEQEWNATCYVNFFVPGWDSATVVEAFHENGDVDNVKVTVKKVMDPKEISLHFLLHLNQDFDDDLLQDAIELLH